MVSGSHNGVSNKGADIGPVEQVDTILVRPKGSSVSDSSSGNGLAGQAHGVPELVGGSGEGNAATTEEKSKRRWFNYLKTKDFWIVLLLGYILHLSTPHERRFRVAQP